MQSTCPDCGGNCQEIEQAMRQSLNLPVRCSMCGAQDSGAVKVRKVGGDWFCYHCATECFD